MTRSATTGLYTRVDNSFSNPVVGTTISPTDADTFFDDVEAAMNSFIGTSTTSLAIGTGTKNFTTQASKSFLDGLFVQAFSQAAPTVDYMYGTVTSYDEGTGALVLDVTVIGGGGTKTDWLLVQAGARGATGATGATGPVAGIKQAYSSTTTDADPGAGTFRLNNATPASATEAYLDNVDAGGATVSTIFDLFDDSTTTTKGFLRFEKTTDPTVWAQFAVTGSVVDGTGYRKITLGSGAGSGAFTNTDTFAILFSRTGDAGAGTGDVVGPASAVTGNVVSYNGTTGKLVADSGKLAADVVTGPAASVDSELAVFNSTTGKIIKRSTLTGVLKAASGVASAATDGTDYMSPDTTSNLSAGFTTTSVAVGTKSTGTFTPDPTLGNIQHYTNGGAHTLAPPSSVCTMVIECTNASAGALTTSGFSVVSGDTYSSTGTKKHIFYITKTNGYSELCVKYVTGS